MHESPTHATHALSSTDLAILAAAIAVAAMLLGASPGLTLVLVAAIALVIDVIAFS
jgi:hypothetical protein